MAVARKSSRYRHRDTTMILLAYRHGLRASEVCDLQWHQVELRHLRQYADSGPTLISIEIWPDAATAENAFRSGLVTWENDPRPPDAPVVY
jgi:integrase